MSGPESPAGIVGALSGGALVQVVLIVAGAWLLLAATQRVLPWLGERFTGSYRQYTLASVPVVRLAIIVLAVSMIVPRVVEPTFENLVALLGALGLALGFALKDYVSSVLAGIVALYEVPYRPGDWVEIGGTYGEVRAIGMRAVEVVTPDDNVVSIPHIALWTQPVANANDGTRFLQCAADFYLDPSHDAQAVERVLRDAAYGSPFLSFERPVGVLATEQWGCTRYRVKAYPVDPREQFAFASDLTIRGKAALIALGVGFAGMPAARDTGE